MIKLGSILPEAFKNLFKKPATVGYPFTAAVIADKFRGKVKFTQSLCIGCKLCMRDCPADAIEIIKVADKKFKMFYRMDRCIYCAQCVNTCPKKALEMTEKFDLADYDKSRLSEEQGEQLEVTLTPAAEAAKPADAPEVKK